MGLIFTMLGDALTIDAGLTSEPESREAQRLIRERFASTGPSFATEAVFITSESLTVDDPAFEAFANSLAAALTEGIGDGPESTTVAPDGSLTVVNVPISGGDFPSDTAIGAVERLRDDVIPAAFTGVPARALVGGDTALTKDENDMGFGLAVAVLIDATLVRSVQVPPELAELAT